MLMSCNKQRHNNDDDNNNTLSTLRMIDTNAAIHHSQQLQNMKTTAKRSPLTYK